MNTGDGLQVPPRKMETSMQSTGRLRAFVLAWLAAAVLAQSACSGNSAPQLIASGKAHAEKGELKSAVIQFKAALQADGQSVEARQLLGQTLMDAGEHVNAAVELEKALEQQAPRDVVLPKLVRALQLSGQAKRVVGSYGNEALTDPVAQGEVRASVAAAWLALGDEEKARAQIQLALQAQADLASALVLQARLQARAGDVKAAQDSIERAVVGSGIGRAEAWAVNGDLIHLAQGDAVRSEAAYRKGLELDGRLIPAHAGLVAGRLRAGDLEGAKKQATALRAVWPNHPMTAFVDGQLAFQQRDFARARDRAQALLKILPNEIGVLQLAGAIESEAGSIFMAETHLARALQLSPDLSHARRMLARVYSRQGQPDRALGTLAPLIGPDSQDSEALTIAGEALLKRENPLEAEAYFERAAKITPDDEKVRTMLAMSHFARGNAEVGFSELESVARWGKSLFAEKAIISARLKRREFDAAVAAVEAIEAKTAPSASTAELRGRIALARPDFAAARTAFEQAAKLDPKLFAATANLAAIDIAQNKFDDAQKRLEASVAADPRNHLALLALADLGQRRDAPVEDTKSLYQRAVQAAPDAAEPRARQIEFLIRKRLFKDTLAAAQEAAAALPQDLTMLDMVGQAQMAAGDTEQAISSFRRLAAGNPKSALPYLRLADLFKATSQREQAESALKKALELEPENVNAQASFLALLTLSGRTDDALLFARGLQRRAPAKAGGYLAEGAFHRHQKAPELALAAYRKGLAASSDPVLTRVLYDYLLEQRRPAEAAAVSAGWDRGRPYDAAADMQFVTIDIKYLAYTSAEARLVRITKVQPKNLMALNNLAWLLAKRGKPESVAIARRALEIAPNNSAVMDTLAHALLVERKFDEALTVQQRAVDLSPGAHDLRLGLARIALQAGRKDLARAELDRLKGAGPSYARQDEVSSLSKEL